MLPDDGDRTARPFIHEPAGYAILAATLGLEPAALEAELSDRSTFLEDLAIRGVCDPGSVAMAVRSYSGDVR
jgi:hypothetical protein